MITCSLYFMPTDLVSRNQSDKDVTEKICFEFYGVVNII